MTTPSMIIESFPVGPLSCNCTILGDPVSKKAIVVDPGGACAVDRDALCRGRKEYIENIVGITAHDGENQVGIDSATRDTDGPARPRIGSVAETGIEVAAVRIAVLDLHRALGRHKRVIDGDIGMAEAVHGHVQV